jgi:hypothetical protein
VLCEPISTSLGQGFESLECRNCHSAASRDIAKQSPPASVTHQRFLFPGEKTCIDCHKGIAHHLPDTRGVPGLAIVRRIIDLTVSAGIMAMARAAFRYLTDIGVWLNVCFVPILLQKCVEACGEP